jgi:hypothetical protein
MFILCLQSTAIGIHPGTHKFSPKLSIFYFKILFIIIFSLELWLESSSFLWDFSLTSDGFVCLYYASPHCYVSRNFHTSIFYSSKVSQCSFFSTTEQFSLVHAFRELRLRRNKKKDYLFSYVEVLLFVSDFSKNYVSTWVEISNKKFIKMLLAAPYLLHAGWQTALHATDDREVLHRFTARA